MSYTSIKAIWPGKRSATIAKLSNSWGSAPVIWNALCEKHRLGRQVVGGGFLPCYFGLDDNPHRLWDLYSDISIPLAHRAVLGLTFDRAYVEQANYTRMAANIRTFLADFPVPAGHANHWPYIAKFLADLPDYPAIGLHCTSVSEDPFLGPWNEEKEDYGPFDWSTAFEVYENMPGEVDDA